MMTTTATNLARLSQSIDDGNIVNGFTPEHMLWVRVAKAGEEVGEAIAALVGWEGSNPRKGVTHTRDDLIKELLDVALTGLLATEHILGNTGDALALFNEHVATRLERVGLEAQR